MILFIFLVILTLIIYKLNYKKTGYYPLLTYVISFFLFGLFLVEVGLFSLNYLESDELSYWQLSLNNLGSAKLDRLFWIYLNDLLRYYDIGGILAVKIISIPFLFMTLYMIWSLFLKDKRIFLVVLFLPYLPHLATKNLRDVAILFFVTSTFFLFYKVKYGRILFLIPIILLFITRPFIGFLCLIIIPAEKFFFKYVKFPKRYIRRSSLRMILLYTLGLVLAFFALKSIPYIESRVKSYYFYFDYYTSGGGYQQKLEDREGISTGNKTTDYLIGGIRYITTPIPTSMVKRVLSGGTEDWGRIDDIIRMINQIFYYFFMFYALFNFKSIYCKLKLIEPGARQLILLLLFYLPVYSFYGFGVTHQRNKLPFQLAFFLFFIINTNLKNKKPRNNRITN